MGKRDDIFIPDLSMIVATHTKYGKRRSVASSFIPTLKPGGLFSEGFDVAGFKRSEECCYNNMQTMRLLHTAKSQ